MRVVFLALAMLFSLTIFGQTNYTMSNTTITSCSGQFQSSLGFASNGSGYAANENFTMTFCPGSGGTIISMDFQTFALGAGDVLTVYNGANTSAPILGVYDATNPLFGIISANQSTNPGGCLTFVFVSDTAVQLNGWSALFSCTIPCQAFEIEIDSLSPDTSMGGFVDLCVDDTAYLSVTGNYYTNDLNYHQSDTNTQFYWYIDTTLIDSGRSILFPPDTSGAFMLQIFAVDSLGCTADYNLNLWVRVSTTPDFSPTYVQYDTLCYGDTNILHIGILSTPWTNADSAVSAPTTFLPDGTGSNPGVYANTLTFSKFASGDTISNISQLTRFWAVMEHSYLGDLTMSLACPNGTSVILKNFPGGGGRWLGAACDGNNTPTPGIGWLYEWMPTGNAQTNMVAHSGACTGCLPTVNPCNALQTGTALQSSTYDAFGAMSNFVGCPLNGTWTFTIVDQWGTDNGFLFNWGIDFDSALYPSTIIAYDPGIDSTWLDTSALAVTVSNTPDSIVMVPLVDDTTMCYTVNVMDGFGCTYDTTLCFYVRDRCDPVCYQPMVPGFTMKKVSCPGGSDGELIASPIPSQMPFPWTYIWTDATGTVIQTSNLLTTPDTLSGLVDGTYGLQIIDGNGCSSNWLRTVTTVNPMQTTVAGISQTSCAGVGCDATALGVSFFGTQPYTYLWSSGDSLQNASMLCAGPNWLVVTDANGCTDTSTFMVTEPDSIEAIGLGDTLICVGNTTTISGDAIGGTPPYSYSWSQGLGATQSVSASPIVDDSYWVYVTDANNCPVDSAQVFVDVRPPLSLSFDNPDTLCPGDTVDLTAYPHGGDSTYTYAWSNGLGSTANVQTLVATSQFYTITLTDACGSIPAVDSVYLQVGGYPQLKVSTTRDDTICIGEQFYLFAQATGGDGNFTYEWDNGLGFGQAHLVVPTTHMQYIVTVVDECFTPAGYDTVNVAVGNFEDFEALVDTPSLCDPGLFTFTFDTLNPRFTYEMDFGTGFEQVDPYQGISQLYTIDGCYDITVRLTSPYGCETDRKYPCMVTVFPRPEADFDFNPHAPTIHQPYVDFWDESEGATAWNWYLDGAMVNNKEQFTLPMQDSGLYNMKLVVSNDFGCFDSVDTDVPVRFNTTYYLPTGFTPDGNDINDQFNVVGEGLLERDFHLIIYDRWGGIVFESFDLHTGWNGKMNNTGEYLMPGAYSYVITFRIHNTRKITETGSVNLMR